MKKVILSTLFVFSMLFVAGQAKSVGYLYTLETGSKEAFHYSISTKFTNGAFQTIYKVYKPGTSKERYTITASHFKTDKKIIVEVNDEQYLLSVMNGKEEVEYETEKLQPFGIRGNLGILNNSAPNQLAVQFASSRFEYVRVINFLGSYRGNIFQFFLFNKNDKITEPKQGVLEPSKNNLPQAKFTPSVQVDSSITHHQFKKNVILPTDYSTLRSIYTPTDLLKIYDKRNIQGRDSYDYEGTLQGKEYVLYSNTKNEVVVRFENNESNQICMRSKNSEWRLPYNLYVGMTLKEVIAVNGKDFKLYGFEWDYSGGLASWENGNLQDKEVSIVLSAPDNVNSSLYQKFIGEKQYDTNSQELRSLGLFVAEITLHNTKK